MAEEDASNQGNLAFLKMLKSSAFAQEVRKFITDLREGKELEDKVWWERFDTAVTQWFVTAELKRGWKELLHRCWNDPRPVRKVHGEVQKGDMRPWKNGVLRERFAEDLVSDVQRRFEGDVLSDVSFALGPTPWKEGREHSDISAKFLSRVRRKGSR